MIPLSGLEGVPALRLLEDGAACFAVGSLGLADEAGRIANGDVGRNCCDERAAGVGWNEGCETS